MEMPWQAWTLYQIRGTVQNINGVLLPQRVEHAARQAGTSIGQKEAKTAITEAKRAQMGLPSLPTPAQRPGNSSTDGTFDKNVFHSAPLSIMARLLRTGATGATLRS